MVNENRIAAQKIFHVSQCGSRIHKHQKTIKAHRVSPAYVEIKTGNWTSFDRERSPKIIVSTLSKTYSRRLRLIIVSIELSGITRR